MASQSSLDVLAAKQEITELLYLYCRGLDELDLQIVLSVYHPDAIEDRGADVYVGPATEMARLAVTQLREKYAVSQHFIGNVLIKIAGNAADSESYFHAYHLYRTRPDSAPTEMIMAGRYLDELAHRDGRWGIVRRRMVLDWTRTQAAQNSWLDKHPGALRRIRQCESDAG